MTEIIGNNGWKKRKREIDREIVREKTDGCTQKRRYSPKTTESEKHPGIPGMVVVGGGCDVFFVGGGCTSPSDEG